MPPKLVKALANRSGPRLLSAHLGGRPAEVLPKSTREVEFVLIAATPGDLLDFEIGREQKEARQRHASGQKVTIGGHSHRLTEQAVEIIGREMRAIRHFLERRILGITSVYEIEHGCQTADRIERRGILRGGRRFERSCQDMKNQGVQAHRLGRIRKGGQKGLRGMAETFGLRSAPLPFVHGIHKDAPPEQGVEFQDFREFGIGPVEKRGDGTDSMGQARRGREKMHPAMLHDA